MRAPLAAFPLLLVALVACSDAADPADILSPSAGRSSLAADGAQTIAGSRSFNQPTGYAKISDRAFSTKASSSTDVTGAEGWAAYEYRHGMFTIVSDASSPSSPAKVGQMRYPAGFSSAGVAPGQAAKPLPAGTKRLYLRFWMKLSSNWQSHASGVNKIFHVWMTSPSKNRIFLSFYGTNSSALRFTVHAQNTPAGSVNYTQNVGSKPTRLGQWQRYELILVMNTPGSSNGQVHAWVDGTKVIDRKNVPFVYRGEPAVMNDLQWSPTWGGTGGPAVRQTMYMWLDHVYMSGSK
jgi:hypothetical protein